MSMRRMCSTPEQTIMPEYEQYREGTGANRYVTAMPSSKLPPLLYYVASIDDEVALLLLGVRRVMSQLVYRATYVYLVTQLATCRKEGANIYYIALLSI